MNPIPSLHPDPRTWRSLSRNEQDPAYPTKIEDWLYTDRPQLSLHIMSFEDATLVSLTWPHTLQDVMGLAELFKAWSPVLNGRVNEVSDLQGVEIDPIATFGENCREEGVLKRHRMTGLYFVLFVINYVLEIVLHPKESFRNVCLPASAIIKLKAQAMSEVRVTDPNAYVSEGDVVCAWWARHAALHLEGKRDRTISVMNAYDLRPTLSTTRATTLKPLLRANVPYIGNCVQSVFAFIPLSELLAKPLSYTALAIRNSIIEQGSFAQQESLAYEIKRISTPPVYGGSRGMMVVFTNWTKAGLYDIDFSAAVVKKKEGRREDRIGKPSYLHTHGFQNGDKLRNTAPIFGKDENGNYWLSTSMRDENWKGVEDAFQREWGVKGN